MTNIDDLLREAGRNWRNRQVAPAVDLDRATHATHRPYRRASVVVVLPLLVAVAAGTAVVLATRSDNVAVVTAPSSGDNSRVIVSRSAGPNLPELTVTYPTDWQIASTSLTPELSDPKEILSLGTFPMVPSDHNCAHVPVNALEDMGDDDAFLWVAVEAGIVQQQFGARRDADVTERPARFGATSGVDAADPGIDVQACLNRRLAGTARWISWREHGLTIYAIAAYGPGASSELRSQTWSILDTLNVQESSVGEASVQTCEDRPTGEGGITGDGSDIPRADWRESSLLVGQVGFFDPDAYVDYPPWHFASNAPPGSPGHDGLILTVIVEAGTNATIIVPNEARNSVLLLDLTRTAPLSSSHPTLADGVPELRLEACPAEDTGFIIGMIPDGAQCVPLDVSTSATSLRRVNLSLGVGVGTCS